jgi:hypothetical protein
VDAFDDPFEDGNGTTRSVSSSAAAPANSSEDSTPPPLMVDQLPKTESKGPSMSGEAAKSGPGVLKPEAEGKPRVRRGDTLNPCALAQFTAIKDIRRDFTIKGRQPDRCPIRAGELPDRQTTGWAPVTFTWKASGLCHKPAYFEDVHLERYGHSWGPYLQPVISGGHFFLTVPILPYKMGLYPPNECIYTLGYYRPGSCAPYMLDPLPLSLRAALFEAGAWTGMAFLIP